MAFELQGAQSWEGELLATIGLASITSFRV